MDRQRRAGFTLTELLGVILIVAILIALLMPALTSAWYAAYTTECKTHLETIYQASVTYMNDTQMNRNWIWFPTGKAWVYLLMPYVEGNLTVFTCPAALPPKGLAGAGSWSDGGGYTNPPGGYTGGGTPGGYYGELPGTSWSASDLPPPTPYCQFAFDIFNGKNTAVEAYHWTAMVTSEWARSLRTGPNTWHYMIEDLGYIGGGDRDYNDIDVEVTYENGLPTQIKIIQEDQSNAYGYNLTINGVTVVTRLDDHRGLVVKLVSSPDGIAPPTSGIGQGTPGSSTPPEIGSDGSWRFLVQMPSSADALRPSNYGLNKGTYDLNITKPDAKLIFILDHGCDDNALVVDAFDGTFDKYFFDIKNLANWNSAWNKDGASDWREYQSLRHFRQANVLFCDGHIESLGLGDLDPINSAARSRWK